MFKRKTQSSSKKRRRPAAAPPKSGGLVFSYHAGRPAASGKQEGDRPARARARTPWMRRTLQIVVVLVAGALLVSNLLLASTPKIVTVGAGDSHAFLRDPEVYQNAAHKLLASSIFNSNKLTIDAQAVSSALQAEFPELAGVSVALPLIGRQPVVYVQPSTSRLLLSTPRGETFVVDGSGKAIVAGAQAAALRKVGLPEVLDESGLDVRLGASVMPGASVAFITEAARQLQAKKVAVASMTLPAASSELHVRLQGVPYLVKMNVRGDAREGTGAFLAAKQHAEAQGKTVNEYFDVRVDNRVFFK